MKKIIFSFLLFAPVVTFAFGFPDLKTFSQEVVQVLDIILNITISIAFIAFFWGLAKFILASGNEKEISNGKEFMLYGIFALFALVSFKAIILFFSGQFEFGNALPSEERLKNFLPANGNDSTIGGWRDPITDDPI